MVFKIMALTFLTIVGFAVPPLLVAAVIGWYFLGRTVRARYRALRADESRRLSEPARREYDAAMRYFA